MAYALDSDRNIRFSFGTIDSDEARASSRFYIKGAAGLTVDNVVTELFTRYSFMKNPMGIRPRMRVVFRFRDKAEAAKIKSAARDGLFYGSDLRYKGILNLQTIKVAAYEQFPSMRIAIPGFGGAAPTLVTGANATEGPTSGGDTETIKTLQSDVQNLLLAICPTDPANVASGTIIFKDNLGRTLFGGVVPGSKNYRAHYVKKTRASGGIRRG